MGRGARCRPARPGAPERKADVLGAAAVFSDRGSAVKPARLPAPVSMKCRFLIKNLPLIIITYVSIFLSFCPFKSIRTETGWVLLAHTIAQ